MPARSSLVVSSRGGSDGRLWGKMVYFLMLAGLIIGICHLLPRSLPGRPLSACLFIIVGFIAAQGALSGVITALGLTPRGPLHDVLKYIPHYNVDRPAFLLLGSSFPHQPLA